MYQFCKTMDKCKMYNIHTYMYGFIEKRVTDKKKEKYIKKEEIVIYRNVL